MWLPAQQAVPVLPLYAKTLMECPSPGGLCRMSCCKHAVSSIRAGLSSVG